MGMADEEAWISPSFIIVLDGESEYDTRWITTACWNLSSLLLRGPFDNFRMYLYLVGAPSSMSRIANMEQAL